MDQLAAEATYGLPGDALTAAMSWSLYSLRKEWNAAKGVAAAWWSECSNEAFNTGLDQLAGALKTGRTPGPEAARAAGLVKRQPGRAQDRDHFTTRWDCGLSAPEHSATTAVPVRCRQAVAASPPGCIGGLT